MATVWEHVGDVLASDCTVICHQANCFTTMGSGIARQIKARYPQAFQADIDFHVVSGSRDRLGRHSFAFVDDNKRIIANLYGQHRYGKDKKHTEEDKLKQALHGFLFKLSVFHGKHPEFRIKIGMPMYIGCGLGGGDWNIVHPMLEEYAERFGFDIHLYRLKS